MPAGFPKFRFIYKWYEKLQGQVVIKVNVLLMEVTFFGLLKIIVIFIIHPVGLCLFLLNA